MDPTSADSYTEHCIFAPNALHQGDVQAMLSPGRCLSGKSALRSPWRSAADGYEHIILKLMLLKVTCLDHHFVELVNPEMTIEELTRSIEKRMKTAYNMMVGVKQIQLDGFDLPLSYKSGDVLNQRDELCAIVSPKSTRTTKKPVKLAKAVSEDETKPTALSTPPASPTQVGESMQSIPEEKKTDSKPSNQESRKMELTCPFCSKTYSQKKSYDTHVSKTCGSAIVDCDTCHESMQRKAIKKHSKKCTASRFPTTATIASTQEETTKEEESGAGSVISATAQSAEHEKQKDVVDLARPVVSTLYLCDLCEKYFVAQAHLDLHNSLFHTAISAKEQSSKKRPQSTISVDQDSEWQCGHCPVSFSQKKKWKKHVKKEHATAYKAAKSNQ